jgi:hypothetical protein
LKDTRALAIKGIDLFFDGGSLLFTFESQEGKEILFVLSAPRQRKDQAHFLSLYKNSVIKLVPNSDYEEASTLLRQKLVAGMKSGLQQRWAAYNEDAEDLTQLLEHGGRRDDLTGFYLRSTERAREAHQQFLNKQQKAVTGTGQP